MKRFASLVLILALCINCITITTYAERDVSGETVLAQELKELGLFRGVSETNFDLGRPPSRVEAVVMLIRVLGVENDIDDKDWNHPFTDVPGWADDYIGYAYANGLTNGESQTTFGVGDTNAAMYITFVLRALGYSDADGKDFVWNDPFLLARQTGILPASVNVNDFWRADVVLISHAALDAYLKGSQQTLAQKLISADVFTQEKYDSVYNKSSSAESNNKGALTAEETYAKCSPAVFYIELYDKYGSAFSSGSGFFIDDDGTAVTNYHVIEDAYSAKIQVSDTEEIYDVIGVYDYNSEHDWAVIKIDCTNNKYLNISDSSKVVGGATVYAIGSPLGLQNTISEGIISNPARVDGNTTYIQTNAAISSGSSGGALLNKYGEVVGITSAAYTNGQNLNLALPMTYVEGFNKNETTSLTDLFYKGTTYPNSQQGQSGIGGNKKQIAFALLRDFVLRNYQERDRDCCEYIEEIEKEDGSGVYEYILSYYPANGELVVKIMDWYDESHYFAYYFSVEPYSDETFAMYWFGKYSNRSGFVDIANGTASFECAEFSENYRYEFYEYEGDDKGDDQIIAKGMHEEGLEFVNYIFDEYLSSYGRYSVKDLGYTSY